MFRVWHKENDLHVSFGATLENVDRVALETKRFLLDHHVEQSVFETTLVLREGLLNAVLDGSHLDGDTPVHFSLALKDDILIMEIEDTGNGFDWRGQLGDIPVAEAESGRGLAIMELYCDSVQFNEKGNKLTLKKHVPSEQSHLNNV